MREVLVAIFAAVLLGVVANGVYTNLKLRRHGGRVTAQVVSVRAHQSTGTDENGTRTRITTYKAVLSFTTQDGQHIMAEERNGGRRPHARPGAEVPVRYDSRNPSLVEIDTFRGRWSAQTVFCAALFIAIVVYAIVVR
jgi:hypothetical protein